jgi:heme-degrading monooxygenase HmoA
VEEVFFTVVRAAFGQVRSCLHCGKKTTHYWASEAERSTRDMFAAIRYYQADPPSIDEVVRRVQEDFVPLIKDMQGFVSYFILVPSEREEDIVSVSVFEDQQSAEESNSKAAEWVVQNLGELLRPSPEFASGRVVVYEASR